MMSQLEKMLDVNIADARLLSKPPHPVDARLPGLWGCPRAGAFMEGFNHLQLTNPR